jgi:phosphosulfolactate synthase
MAASTHIQLTPTLHATPTREAFLHSLGVCEIGPRTCPFDPGYDPLTLESHLRQSAHLIDVLKISMACWLVADDQATRAKLAAAARAGVETTTGGGPFEIAVAHGRLPQYLELCAEYGFNRIECGGGFTELVWSPEAVVDAASACGLEVQFEVGGKHTGAFRSGAMRELIGQGRAWLDAGARAVVIEARESAAGVGLFDENGTLNTRLADRFAEVFGLDSLTFEAPTKRSQFALLDHFGPQVKLGNVRLEEILRVEIYRRGLHADAFGKPNLRPMAPG